MKKNLRLLCLGLAAATITCGFAQEDKTSLLKNADMELGLKGWAFDGTDFVGKNKKYPATHSQAGFYGMNLGVLESWHSDPSNPLGDSYVMQRLGNLPSGTYVFGAYAAASKQHNRNDICERDDEDTHILIEDEEGNKKHQYSDYWSNRDSINGVVLFANDATVRVAADNPDLAANGQYFGHSSKFNVAVTLTDADEKKGYMDVGMRVSETNANYVVWDNVTLYYFGDMSEAEALDAMAEIDITKVAAIADTLKTYVMQNDTLANLEAAIAAAAAKTSTAATLWDDCEEIHEAAAKARKSILDYENLKKNIETATAVSNWENLVYVTDDLLPMLQDYIAVAQEAYDAKAMDRAELTELRNELNYYVGAVKFDSLYVASDDLAYFMEQVLDKLGQSGGYSQSQYNTLNELYEELLDTMTNYEDIWGAEYEKEAYNPNNLWPYVARVYAAIQNVKDNPMDTEFTKMPLTIKAGEDGWMEGTTDNGNLKQYISPLYQFAGNVETVTFTVKQAKGGNKYFCLSEFSVFDADGEEIELTEESFASDYDHNTLNPSSPDGQSFAGLIDDDANTYFHSAWGNIPAGDHSFTVTLPDGGYDAFSFRIVSRPGQNHQFPAEMVISTPMPNRAALESTLTRAKALDAYSNGEVGFYTKDFSYLTDLIVEIEAALVNNPSESECKTMDNDLRTAVGRFNGDMDKAINLPVSGKVYHIVSGNTKFYEVQSVEKAITVHTDSLQYLWWANASADSLQQQFVFDPILVDDEHYIYHEIKNNDDGSTSDIPYYAYTVKNVETGLYIDSTFVDGKLHLVSEATDTVFLKPLGRGQWNIIVRGNVIHAGDHNSGNVGGSGGAFGGTWGVSSGITYWNEGIDSPSAWFIREMPELPLTQLVAAGEYKSECFHFAPANTVVLTADCAFENLAFYDLYGKAIEAEDVTVTGNKAVATFATNIVGCAFAFTNNEGVASVEFDAFLSDISLLQIAYDEAVAVNPTEGTDVMQYPDLSAYNAALAAAEEMLTTGASKEDIEAMIQQLEDVVAALVPNMPVEGKYYFIYNAVEAFEKNKGYRMTLYSQGSTDLRWGAENEIEWNRYWQFEKATAAELKAAGMAEDATAYFIKSIAAEGYIADNCVLKSEKAESMPIVITSLVGSEVALDGLGQSGKRLHANNHGGGAGNGSNIVYWGSGAGTASAWHIVEAQYDATDLDFTVIEDENKAVVKGTFDLFGRRVVAPTAPGIYIIDGRKKLVK